MKKYLIKIVLSLLFIYSPFAKSSDFPYEYAATLDKYNLYQVIKKATVRINIWENWLEDDAYKITGGSGVIINNFDDDFFIVTNAHVALDTFCLIGEENCETKEWGDNISIVIDHPDTEFEYSINDLTYWYNNDLAILSFTIYEEDRNKLSPIPIGGEWYPLMDIYGAGFPSILGNYDTNYPRMIFCAGAVYAMFSTETELNELSNYSLAHGCTLAGGMSGGPLIDEYGFLLGINGLTGVSEVSGKKDSLDIDIAPANFNYAIDIWDLYWLEINDEAGHFNSESTFYNYLPKLSSYYHEAWYNDFVELFPEKEELIKSLFN